MKSSNTKRSRTGTYKDAPKSKKARTRTALPDLAMEQCLPPPTRLQPPRTAKSNHHQIPTTTPSPQQQQQETSVPLIRQKRTRTTRNQQTATLRKKVLLKECIPLLAPGKPIQMQQDTVAGNNTQQADPPQVEQPIVESQSKETAATVNPPHSLNPPAVINPPLQANATNSTGMQQQQSEHARPFHLHRQDLANPSASQNRVQVHRSTSDQIPIRSRPQPHVLRAAAEIGNRNLRGLQNSSVVANSNQNNVAGALRHIQFQRQQILTQNIPLGLQPQQPPLAFPYQQPKQLPTKKPRTRTTFPCLGPSASTRANNVQSQRPSISSQQESNVTSEHQAQSGTKTAAISQQELNSQSIDDSTSQSQKKPIDVDSCRRLVAVMKTFGERFQKKEITFQQFLESLKDASIKGIPKGRAYEVWSKMCEEATKNWKSGRSNNGFNDVIQIQRKFDSNFCAQRGNVSTKQSNAPSQRNGTNQNSNGHAVVVAASTEASEIPTSQNGGNGQYPAADAAAPRDDSEVPPNPATFQSFPDLPQINGQPQTHVVQLFENQLKQYVTGYQNIVAQQIEALKNLCNNNNV